MCFSLQFSLGYQQHNSYISKVFQEDEIHIVNAERVFKKREGELKVTASVVITFQVETEKRPDTVLILGEKYQVHQYIPEPVMCFNCQRLGHRAINCKGKQFCAKCSDNHRADECESSTKKCPNCLGSHSSSYRGCPAWKSSRAVIKVSVSENISRSAAAARVESGQSYAAAAAAGARPTPANQQAAAVTTTMMGPRNGQSTSSNPAEGPTSVDPMSQPQTQKERLKKNNPKPTESWRQ